MFAHYQLGMACREARLAARPRPSRRQRCSTRRSGYAHYYGGMSFYQAKRLDKMAASFERFLKLAPAAPSARR
jgi:hypothetical protein